MLSRWAYILVGDNNSGKTSLQRGLQANLCGVPYKRLPSDLRSPVTHPRAIRRFRSLFTCNRSFQEKRRVYKTVDRYFTRCFQDADVCILSSHSHGNCIDDVRAMQDNLRRRCYNVAGVFWSNAFDSKTEMIASSLQWNEVLWIDNPLLEDQASIDAQLQRIASEFGDLLIARAAIN